MEAVYVHDAAAFTAVLQPELFSWHKGPVLVACSGPFRGRSLVDEGECSREVERLINFANPGCVFSKGAQT